MVRVAESATQKPDPSKARPEILVPGLSNEPSTSPVSASTLRILLVWASAAHKVPSPYSRAVNDPRCIFSRFRTSPPRNPTLEIKTSAWPQTQRSAPS